MQCSSQEYNFNAVCKCMKIKVGYIQFSWCFKYSWRQFYFTSFCSQTFHMLFCVNMEICKSGFILGTTTVRRFSGDTYRSDLRMILNSWWQCVTRPARTASSHQHRSVLKVIFISKFYLKSCSTVTTQV